ncbi:hypothetical protein CTM88_20385 [Photobacterium aquimaris]|uniref:Uncharacterized protein n=1 Tax=Photobacterium aquimaris TaxID=512643 RepID=A0A2T3IEH4_9GAMM|nr:hypothetical protein [Photobacterium aquimaris]OBU17620.1 hypothetical protein AYY20_18925 [Photobacterium aquimaris]PSU22461.1 hypothetical protein CTM88_20385 [Photobacterium aquimaris]
MLKVTINDDEYNVVTTLNSLIENNIFEKKIMVIEATGAFISQKNRLLNSRLHIVLNDKPLILTHVNYIDLSQIINNPIAIQIAITTLILDQEPTLILLRDKLLQPSTVREILTLARSPLIHIKA